jgi:hypothetical protein
MALDFIVYNTPLDDGPNPSGLRVEILSATASDTPPAPVPEPSTWVLFGAGMLILAIYARRGSRVDSLIYGLTSGPRHADRSG